MYNNGVSIYVWYSCAVLSDWVFPVNLIDRNLASHPRQRL
jgi:hypothetical protein